MKIKPISIKMPRWLIVFLVLFLTIFCVLCGTVARCQYMIWKCLVVNSEAVERNTMVVIAYSEALVGKLEAKEKKK